MFIGHFAVALASKRAAPRVSLGILITAAQFLDLLWPLLLLIGVEHVRIAPGNTRFTPLDFYDYPISHSLVTALGWAAAFAIVYFLIRKNHRAAVLLFLLVFSHWVLDAVAHRPDLPLVPGGSRFVGLGLWNSVPGTLGVESLLFLIAVFIYARSTRPRNRTGKAAFWSFVIALYAIYIANLFGPPPPTVKAIAWLGMAQWLFVLWAWWLDRTVLPPLTRTALLRAAPPAAK